MHVVDVESSGRLSIRTCTRAFPIFGGSNTVVSRKSLFCIETLQQPDIRSPSSPLISLLPPISSTPQPQDLIRNSRSSPDPSFFFFFYRMAPKLFVQPPRKSLESASYVLELFSPSFPHTSSVLPRERNAKTDNQPKGRKSKQCRKFSKEGGGVVHTQMFP